MVQIQPVNNYAAKRYSEFESALEAVHSALLGTDALVRVMKEGTAQRGDFRLPDKKEVLAARRKAASMINTLRKEAKKYEGELISKGWRV